MKKKLIVLAGSVFAFAPFLALAQVTGGGVVGRTTSCRGVTLGSIEGIICKIGDLLAIVIPILITLAVILFIWGVIQYVISDDEEAKSKGRDRIIFGLIGFVAIISLWGLVKILTNTFGIETGPQNITIPTPSY